MFLPVELSIPSGKLATIYPWGPTISRSHALLQKWFAVSPQVEDFARYEKNWGDWYGEHRRQGGPM